MADFMDVKAYQVVKGKQENRDVSLEEAVEAVENGWEFQADMLPWRR